MLRRIFIISSLVVMVLYGWFVVDYVRADTFLSPGKSAPELPAGVTLNKPSTDTTIRLDTANQQNMWGPVVVASTTYTGASTSSTAFIGVADRRAAVIGIARTPNVVYPVEYPTGGAGLYGYASDPISAVGIYGYAKETAGSSVAPYGIYGVSASYAGFFYGKTQIEGNLTIGGDIRVPYLTVQSSDASRPAVYVPKGVQVSGAQDVPLYAYSNSSFGLLGRSIVPGTTIRGTIWIPYTSPGTRTNDVTVVRGRTYSPTQTEAGVTGVTTSGYGIQLVNNYNTYFNSHTLAIATTSNLLGYGVYGVGGAAGGHFYGNIKVESGKLDIAGYALTECTLKFLLTWCNRDPLMKCPDGCTVDGSGNPQDVAACRSLTEFCP